MRFPPPIAGERVRVGVGWKWAPIGGLQYQTHMHAPEYDVQFLRSEALRSSSSSSSSSRTWQIKECKIVIQLHNEYLQLMKTFITFINIK